jgi:hypothetical protein
VVGATVQDITEWDKISCMRVTAIVGYILKERTKVQYSGRVVTQTNSSLQTEEKRILSDK